MKPINFQCEVITPMFLGNAVKGEAELRPTAIKAALRFWWRALHGHLSVKQLHEQESTIFGSADPKVGRSKVVITIGKQPTPQKITFPNVRVRTEMYGDTRKGNMNVDLMKYISYGTEGLYAIDTGSDFSFSIACPKDTQEIIKKCVWLSSVFGGLGSKARNGLGRFQIKEVNSVDLNPYLKQLFNGSLSNWTAFSKKTRLYKLHANSAEWTEHIGQFARSYKLAKERLGDTPHKFDKRRYIALPVGSISKLRHGKSLFFGIDRAGNKLESYALFMPYNYFTHGHEEIEKSGVSFTPTNETYMKTWDRFWQEFENKTLL